MAEGRAPTAHIVEDYGNNRMAYVPRGASVMIAGAHLALLPTGEMNDQGQHMVYPTPAFAIVTPLFPVDEAARRLSRSTKEFTEEAVNEDLEKGALRQGPPICFSHGGQFTNLSLIVAAEARDIAHALPDPNNPHRSARDIYENRHRTIHVSDGAILRMDPTDPTRRTPMMPLVAANYLVEEDGLRGRIAVTGSHEDGTERTVISSKGRWVGTFSIDPLPEVEDPGADMRVHVHAAPVVKDESPSRGRDDGNSTFDPIGFTLISGGPVLRNPGQSVPKSVEHQSDAEFPGRVIVPSHGQPSGVRREKVRVRRAGAVPREGRDEQRSFRPQRGLD